MAGMGRTGSETDNGEGNYPPHPSRSSAELWSRPLLRTAALIGFGASRSTDDSACQTLSASARSSTRSNSGSCCWLACGGAGGRAVLATACCTAGGARLARNRTRSWSNCLAPAFHRPPTCVPSTMSCCGPPARLGQTRARERRDQCRVAAEGPPNGVAP